MGYPLLSPTLLRQYTQEVSLGRGILKAMISTGLSKTPTRKLVKWERNESKACACGHKTRRQLISCVIVQTTVGINRNIRVNGTKCHPSWPSKPDHASFHYTSVKLHPAWLMKINSVESTEVEAQHSWRLCPLCYHTEAESICSCKQQPECKWGLQS